MYAGICGDVRSVCSTAAGGAQALQLAPGTLRAAREEAFPPLSTSVRGGRESKRKKKE